MANEGPLVTEPLIVIGYWANGLGNGRWPDVREFVDEEWSDEERIEVGPYLGHGLVARAWMGYSTCRFCGSNNGNVDLTDGVYLWPEGLAPTCENTVSDSLRTLPSTCGDGRR